MSESDDRLAIGVRWDLRNLYRGPGDRNLIADLQAADSFARKFHSAAGRGNPRGLAEALEALLACRLRLERVRLYLRLTKKIGLTDGGTGIFRKAEAYLRGLDQEWLQPGLRRLNRIDPVVISMASYQFPPVRQNLPWFEIQHFHATNRLPQPSQETRGRQLAHRQALKELAIRLPPAAGQPKGNLNLSQALAIVNGCPQTERRRIALRALNDALGQPAVIESAAIALNATVTDHLAAIRKVGQEDPMFWRNQMNDLSATAVASLHDAVERLAATAVRRHSRLKARLLRLEGRLQMADLNAPPAVLGGDRPMPFSEACRCLRTAHGHYLDRQCADLVSQLLENGQIDAECRPGKDGGANNASIDQYGTASSYIMLNWHGQERNLDTLAHEVGHALRAKLAAEAQGPLLSGSSMLLSESAALVSEAMVYEHRSRWAAYNQQPREQLRLLMARLDSLMGTTVRQVCLSRFEQQLYRIGYGGGEDDCRLSAADLSRLWHDQMLRFYGSHLDCRDYDHFWTRILHFHRPFAVYGYAAAELLTEALMQRWRRYGRKFQPVYLEILANGQAKRAQDLLRPLGINLEATAFWEQTLRSALVRLLTKAEKLAAQLQSA